RAREVHAPGFCRGHTVPSPSVRITSAVHLQNGATLPFDLPSRCPPFWQVQPLVRSSLPNRGFRATDLVPLQESDKPKRAVLRAKRKDQDQHDHERVMEAWHSVLKQQKREQYHQHRKPDV